MAYIIPGHLVKSESENLEMLEGANYGLYHTRPFS